MRRLWAALALLFFVPTATAEFGAYDEHGYPVNVLGESTYPGGVLPGAGVGPVNAIGPLTVYPYYPVLTAEVQRLAREHPDIVKLHSAGKSTAGLDLWLLEIADFDNPDMIPLDERESVWVDGGTHSNEYSGVYFVAHLASFLADGYGSNETATWIVENRHTWILPMVNPDGSHVMGRLNAHLVNINRNYPVVWDGEGHDELLNNRGPAPASEPETQINIEWLNKTRPDYYASVHCCGNLWLYPYGEEGVDPLDNETFARVCRDAFPDVVDECGPIWSTIYPASGSSVDTAYEYTGAIAFGYEMSGRGALAMWGQPFTAEDVETQEIESWSGIMHAMLNVHRYGAHPVVTAARVEGDALVLTITNEGYGALAGGHVELGAAQGSLPQLAPGASAQVRVEGALAGGAGTLKLHYLKRVATAPEGASFVPIELARDASGALVVATIAGERLDAASTGGGRAVPFAAPLAVLAALALAGLVRRR